MNAFTPDPSASTLPHDRDNCPVEQTLSLLSGKWRLMVLFRLGAGDMRFNALARSLKPVSLKVLAETLRGLEADGLIWRRVDGHVPPAVTYGLTGKGVLLEPVFRAMAEWRLATALDSVHQAPESVSPHPAPSH
jgi:DNA-binding HxlR family transcriptional regulator